MKSSGIVLHVVTLVDVYWCLGGASITSAYRLSTIKINFSRRNGHLLGVEHLLLHRKELRKLKYENRKPACKTAVNRVTKITETKVLGINNLLLSLDMTRTT
jgi:hypothetical protein